MIYLKSLLGGLGTLIAYCFLFVTVGVRLLLPKPPDLPESVGYVSNSPWVPLWLVLVIALLVFSAAYFWTFRRLSRARSRQREGLTGCLTPVSFGTEQQL
jgi:hypothetical protein